MRSLLYGTTSRVDEGCSTLPSLIFGQHRMPIAFERIAERTTGDKVNAPIRFAFGGEEATRNDMIMRCGRNGQGGSAQIGTAVDAAEPVPPKQIHPRVVLAAAATTCIS